VCTVLQCTAIVCLHVFSLHLVECFAVMIVLMEFKMTSFLFQFRLMLCFYILAKHGMLSDLLSS